MVAHVEELTLEAAKVFAHHAQLTRALSILPDNFFPYTSPSHQRVGILFVR